MSQFNTILVLPSVVKNSGVLLGFSYGIKSYYLRTSVYWDRVESYVHRLVNRHGSRWRSYLKDKGSFNRYILVPKEIASMSVFDTDQIVSPVKVMSKKYESDRDSRSKKGTIYITSDATLLPKDYEVISQLSELYDICRDPVNLSHFTSVMMRIPIRFFLDSKFDWLEECQGGFEHSVSVGPAMITRLAACEIKFDGCICVANVSGTRLIRDLSDVRHTDKILLLPSDDLNDFAKLLQWKASRLCRTVNLDTSKFRYCDLVFNFGDRMLNVTVTDTLYRSIKPSLSPGIVDSDLFKDCIYGAISVHVGHDIDLKRRLSAGMFSEYNVRYSGVVIPFGINPYTMFTLSSISRESKRLILVGTKGSGKSTLVSKLRNIGFITNSIDVDGWNKVLWSCNGVIVKDKVSKILDNYLKLNFLERRKVPDYFISFAKDLIVSAKLTTSDISSYRGKYTEVMKLLRLEFQQKLDSDFSPIHFLELYSSKLVSRQCVDDFGMAYAEGRILYSCHTFPEIQQTMGGEYIEIDSSHLDSDVVNTLRYSVNYESAYVGGRILVSRLYESLNTSFIRRATIGAIVERCEYLMT